MQRRATSWRWSGLLLTSLTTMGLAACVGEIGGGDDADGESRLDERGVGLAVDGAGGETAHAAGISI